MRLPPVSTRKRSSRRSASSPAVSVRRRAAASSSASGSPSSRRQISCAASSTTNPGRAAAARSANSVSAGDSASGGTGTSASPSIASASRLVATIFSFGAAFEQRIGEAGGTGDDVLAVVEDDDRVAFGEHVEQAIQRVARRHAGEHRLAQPERAGHRGHDLRVGRDRRELDQPHPVGDLVHVPAHGLARQPRLARTARPEQGDEPGALEQLVDLAELALAADEARHRRGQVRALRGRRLGLEHGEVRLLELGRGHDAELVVQSPARAVVDGERVGLAAGGEQRADQPRREPLVQRVLGVQRLQRAQVAAARSAPRRAAPPAGRPPGRRSGTRAGPRAPARATAPGRRCARTPARPSAPPAGSRPARERPAPRRRAPPQPRDERLQRVHVIGRELVLPHRLDERAGGHRPPGVERQPGEQRPQPPAADRDRVSIVLDLERPEQPYAHPPTVAG